MIPMNNRFKIRLLLSVSVLFVQLIQAQQQKDQNNNLSLWYTAPASNWNEALPIGNGRLGAMVFGKIADEQILLNEETLWTGGPYTATAPEGAVENLARIQQMVFNGDFIAAQKLWFKVNQTIPAHHASYQPLGSVSIQFIGHGLDAESGNAVTGYRRELDLKESSVRVRYKTGGVWFYREIISSIPDQVIAMELTSSGKRKINLNILLNGITNTENPTDEYFRVYTKDQNQLVLQGRNASEQEIKGQVEYQARVFVTNQGGRCTVSGNTLQVRDADSVTLFIPAETSFINYRDVSANPDLRVARRLEAIKGKSFRKIKEDNTRLYQTLFNKVSIELPTSAASDLPTNERLKGFPGNGDQALVALYFQFARYLMICSSWPGTQPPNLQGIWNANKDPAWGSKYTTNINLEMNYWPVDVFNLGECIEPLMHLTRDLAVSGHRTARLHYNAGGWVLGFNTDIWRPTAPMGWQGFFGTWHGAGPWLCQILFDHYLFTQDKNFLDSLYPLMRGAAAFFEQTLVEYPAKGWLVTNPSSSPENAYQVPPNPNYWSIEAFKKGELASICAAPTMDIQLITNLLNNCKQASAILHKDEQMIPVWDSIIRRLPPMQIGRYGQLQEWLEDWDNPLDNHRHISHLWGLYPGTQIDPFKTPALAKAAEVVLDHRGLLSPGWSIAWKLNCYARLLDSKKAYQTLTYLLNYIDVGFDEKPGNFNGGTYPNLFCCHPPFQIDGNFGGAAGIAEMLIQSQQGTISLLPVLPAQWASGSVEGLCARGGYEVDMKWANNRLTAATIRSKVDGVCKVSYKGRMISINMRKGGRYIISANLKYKPDILHLAD
jgi:alpha-L-fucosidase 2